MTTKEQLEKEKAELKAELDELKVRLAKANNDYDKFKELLQQEGLSELLEAKYEDERADAKEIIDLLTKQREPLLVRISKLDDLLNPPLVAPAAASHASRMLAKAQIDSSITGIVEFFAKELKEGARKRSRLNSDTNPESELLVFSSALFNERGLPQAVFIRECYRIEATKVHDWMGTKEAKKETYSVFVGGARGVGKSIFGTWMVFEFVDLGYAVLYEHKQQRMLLFGSNLRAEQKQELLDGFNHKNYDSSILSEPGVYQFRKFHDGDLFDRLTKSNSLIHVLDLGDGSIEQNLPTTGLTRRLILSSPREASLKNLPKLNCKTIIMPLWTEEELQMARMNCYPELTEGTVSAQFAKYGGIARHVLQYSKDVSSREFRKQLGDLKWSDVKAIIAIQKYENLPHLKDMGFLIHVVPDPVDPEACVCTFASPYAFREIVSKFQQQNEFEVREFANLLKQNSKTASLYGPFLEETAHFVLTQESTYTVHELGSGRINPAHGPGGRTVQWPKMENSVCFDDIPEYSG